MRIRIPLMLPFCQIAAASGSIKIANREGERTPRKEEYSLPVPLCEVKLYDVSPLV